MMNSTRRHDSLIPLSHEHHHALVLCLRIHRGLEESNAGEAWLRSMAEKTAGFFASDLRRHFEVEEEVLFPAMECLPEASALLAELLDEHRALERLIAGLPQLSGSGLEGTLRQFADLLKGHIRKEENRLFPLFENLLSPELADQIGGEIQARRQ
jgi:hemerythrin-like domain-containing protein